MNDYDRAGTGSNNSRYGKVAGLEATTEEFTLTKDRSFTFAIDKLDSDETVRNLQAASALERQVREVVVPEVDTYVYNVMCTKAGTKPAAKALNNTNIYTEILAANLALDEAEVPETGRVILVTPATYVLMKQDTNITMETDIGNDLRLKGVIGMLDGATVVKVPANRYCLKTSDSWLLTDVQPRHQQSWQITKSMKTRQESAVHLWKVVSTMTHLFWIIK